MHPLDFDPFSGNLCVFPQVAEFKVITNGISAEYGRTAGGIYLWESRKPAEAVYSGEWLKRVEQLYGGKPVITWFDTPLIVDNLAGLRQAGVGSTG